MMGKEVDLIKAVRNNDHQKIQKLFLPEKGYQVKRASIPSTPQMPGGRIRILLDHININCRESSDAGCTPLILSVLNGNKDIAESLLFHSADVNFPDVKGNTPLHIAVFAGLSDMVDLLIQNNAKIDVQNHDGNTPLHIIAQCDFEHRITIIIKLLKANPSLYIRNKALCTPLDVAAMFNKKDILSIMLDHDASLQYNTTAIIEASIRGHTDIVKLLLDYGVSPNGISDLKETGPLHEATRYGRIAVIDILLKYGANSLVKNMKNESPEELAKDFPGNLGKEMLKKFEESSLIGATAIPKFVTNGNRELPAEPAKCYPELPNDTTWTKNSPMYCNTCTPNNPNTNILDGNPRTFWVMQETHHAWTILDLHHCHTLTGIIIHGWNSLEMIEGFEIRRGGSLEGPWTTVGSFTCARKGSKDPKDEAVAQVFKGFQARSQYWKFNVLNNHGGNYTCFQGITLCGADDRVSEVLNKLKLTQYIDQFICNSCNTYRKLLLQDDADLEKEGLNADDVRKLSAELKKLRKLEIKLKCLKWKHPPPYASMEGTTLPDMVVIGDEGCTDELELSIEGECDVYEGNTVAMLQSETLKTPPTATFQNIIFTKAGTYRIQVQAKSESKVVLRAPADIKVKPASNLSEENVDAFENLQSMLSDMAASLEIS